MKEKVREALNKVRPYLQKDGGDIELVDVTEDGEVKVRLKGACSGCPRAQITVKQGVERVLKKEIPEIQKITHV